jgi:ABC-type multidrug transport system ATPase subunit
MKGVKDYDTHINKLIQAVGLSGYESMKSHNMSGGNKRKLQIALALVGFP